MMNKRNVPVSGANITQVWLEVMDHLLDSGVEQISHLDVRIDGFSDGCPDEYPEARKLLDSALESRGPCNTNANANLIFPESAWKIERHRGTSARDFTKHYHDNLMPRLAKQDTRNLCGTYFDRMVAYPNGGDHVNQLGQLLELVDKNVRRQSAYQLAIYHPGEDLDGSPYMRFPCLDYVAFTRDGDELLLSAFYAYQLIFDRGYGNYLGLCRLGRFMAEQMGLRFAQFSCRVGAAKLTMSKKVNKTYARDLVAQMRESTTKDAEKKAA
ncbi:hypothetical protein [Sorangium sp. So ce1389]|uniref:hypothetical protein n=1 Tax=Sorangium sp. So ce1389 TaxID=3133336 RepID=UPI003F6257CE